MAAELVSCPECKRKLRVPDDLLGKLVKCPTCGQTFTADPVEHAPKEPVPAAAEKPARTSKVGGKADEDEDRVRRRTRDEDDDEDDDRPRRRSRSSREDDEDDDDDRPRRRRRDTLPHRGGAVMTLGILGLVFTFIPIVPLIGLILGIIAWVMGNTDLSEIRAGRMDPEGEGQTNGGRVCGMIAVILHVVGIVVIFGLCCAGGLANNNNRF